MSWAYGVITVSQRLNTTLPRTLESLKRAGFDKPRLFVDGVRSAESISKRFGLEVTARYPVVKTFANWVLALWELYVRNPVSRWYILFQDDILACRNLRQYLERCSYPARKAYFNLYTYPQNQECVPSPNYVGWYQSNQKGLGALALMFDRDAVIDLLSSDHMVTKPTDLNRGWEAVDGAVVVSLKNAGYREYVHMPSLVQHTGVGISTMGKKKRSLAPSFPGENFDALKLLNGGSG